MDKSENGENITKRRARTGEGQVSAYKSNRERGTHPLETATFPSARYEWESHKYPAEGGISRVTHRDHRGRGQSAGQKKASV